MYTGTQAKYLDNNMNVIYKNISDRTKILYGTKYEIIKKIRCIIVYRPKIYK